jgi:hypothetical protein
MREPACIAELRGRLVRHGLPRARIERIIQEVAEHWQDARTNAVKEGLGEAAASAHADVAIGDVPALARSFTSRLRRNHWLGRHPLFGLVILPTLLLPVALVLIGLPVWGFDKLVDLSEIEILKRPPYIHFVVFGVWSLYCLGSAMVPATMSWWAWKVGLGRRFALLVCASCFFASLFRSFNVDIDGIKRSVSLGFRFPPHFDTHFTVMLLLHVVIAFGILFLTRASTRKSLSSPDDKLSAAHEN